MIPQVCRLLTFAFPLTADRLNSRPSTQQALRTLTGQMWVTLARLQTLAPHLFFRYGHRTLFRLIGVSSAFHFMLGICSCTSVQLANWRPQLLQAWKEHRRLQTALPLPRPGLNRQFLAAALARIKNVANGLYAACEVPHASWPVELAPPCP